MAQELLQWWGIEDAAIMKLLDPHGEWGRGSHYTYEVEGFRAELRQGLGDVLGWENVPKDWPASNDAAWAAEDEATAGKGEGDDADG